MQRKSVLLELPPKIKQIFHYSTWCGKTPKIPTNTFTPPSA